MKSLEVIVRANITVKSSIKNLLLRDASTMVSCRWAGGQEGGRMGWAWVGGALLLPTHSSFCPAHSVFLRSQ